MIVSMIGHEHHFSISFFNRLKVEVSWKVTVFAFFFSSLSVSFLVYLWRLLGCIASWPLRLPRLACMCLWTELASIEILHICKHTQCHFSSLRLFQPGWTNIWTGQVTLLHFNNWKHTCRLPCSCSLVFAGPRTSSLARFCFVLRQDCDCATQVSTSSWSRVFSLVPISGTGGRTPQGFLSMLCVHALRLGGGASQKARSCPFASLNWQYNILNG